MSAPTPSQSGLIDQLEQAIGDNDFARRAEVLRKVTDLLVLRSGKFSEDQIALFDTVMGKLLDNIESTARARFGGRIAKLPDAPRGVVRQLAFDAAIEVAGPVLTHSERLDAGTLVDNAKTQSQDHLLAISGRKTLGTVVTDVLVKRGDRAVLRSTARNPGASFSDDGFGTLVHRSERDPTLQQIVGLRSDLPAHHFKLLIEKAAKDVKALLLHRVCLSESSLVAAHAHPEKACSLGAERRCRGTGEFAYHPRDVGAG